MTNHDSSQAKRQMSFINLLSNPVLHSRRLILKLLETEFLAFLHPKTEFWNEGGEHLIIKNIARMVNEIG
jgi:hypothetical protein